VTSFGINISVNPVEQIIGICSIWSFWLTLKNNKISILINVIIKTHTKYTNALFIVTVNIEKTTILTQIIMGE
jgi:hypothetical protein